MIERCAKRGADLITQVLLARSFGREAIHQRLHHVHHERMMGRELFLGGSFGQPARAQASVETVQQVFGGLTFDVLRPPEVRLAEGGVAFPHVNDLRALVEEVRSGNAIEISRIDPQFADHSAHETCPLLYFPGRYGTQFQEHREGQY